MKQLPKADCHIFWNTLMSIAALAATAAGVSAIYKKTEMMGLYVLASYLALVFVVQVLRKPAVTYAVDGGQCFSHR